MRLSLTIITHLDVEDGRTRGKGHQHAQQAVGGRLLHKHGGRRASRGAPGKANLSKEGVGAANECFCRGVFCVLRSSLLSRAGLCDDGEARVVVPFFSLAGVPTAKECEKFEERPHNQDRCRHTMPYCKAHRTTTKERDGRALVCP